MNSNAYDVFYLQYSHQHVAAAEDGRNRVRNMLERKLCTKFIINIAVHFVGYL